jgi:hypothetical protein
MGSKTPFDTFEVEELPSDLHHWRNAFDARFLRFTVLEGKPRVATIENVQWLKSSNKNESKRQLLVTLREFEKPWALNITNSETIEALYGADPRGWIGKRITMYPTKTKLGREVVDCIRVRDQIPEESRQGNKPAQQGNGGNTQPKRERTARERTWLEAMSKAASVEQLAIVEEGIANDNQLSAEEAAALARQLVRRQAQLAPTDATPQAGQDAAS